MTYPGKDHDYDPITFIKREAVIHFRRGGLQVEKKKTILDLDKNHTVLEEELYYLSRQRNQNKV